MPNNLGLKSAALNVNHERTGTVLDVMGPERSGKSDFACSIAIDFSPTVYLALDYNYLAPVKRHRRLGYKIQTAEFFYSLPSAPPTSPKDKDFEKRVNEVAGICRPVFRSFTETLWECLRSPKVGSIIIDNGTSLYKLCRYAMFGYVHKVPRHLYAKSSNAMTTIINQVRYSGKNVCWIHRQSEEWDEKTQKPTGEFYRSGFKDIAYEVMASLQAYYNEEKERFGVEVLDSTFSAGMVGRKFSGSKRTFAHVAAALQAEVE